jgi:hypothetical protein
MIILIKKLRSSVDNLRIKAAVKKKKRKKDGNIANRKIPVLNLEMLKYHPFSPPFSIHLVTYIFSFCIFA